MGPLRGDGKSIVPITNECDVGCREDGSPSWGRKAIASFMSCTFSPVEKMGPLRGDGKILSHQRLLLFHA